MLLSLHALITIIASVWVFVLGCALWFWLPKDRAKTLIVVDAFIVSVWILLLLLGLSAINAVHTQSFVPLLMTGLVLGLTSAVIGILRIIHKEMKQHEGTAELARALKHDKEVLQELDNQKNEFLSIASHQLRTPLSIIKGYVELLGDGTYGKMPKEAKKILENIDCTNERLIHSVDEFLSITRIDQGHARYTFTTTQLNDIIAGVLVELRTRASIKKIKIVWKPEALPTTWLDAEKIRHVIYNLVDNAIKYTPSGTIIIKAKVDQGKLRVDVQDPGVGFTAKEAEGFFQKFYRADRARHSEANGTGLGLYVCRKFAEGHDGSMECFSRGSGQGSTFSLLLPIRHH